MSKRTERKWTKEEVITMKTAQLWSLERLKENLEKQIEEVSLELKKVVEK